ncbi:glycine--tRNA ligase subunit beta [Lentibacillus amyloliquefaciens]|uniref:Glycine--tRNA ligase beta subunit n=1 Tax=Lentibacillus amyloliquefaciens TaxID=1472767 RepID=A0A0U3WEA0_9BACI|nr:glycine--tRNA ligase subunit beta [Lentibacillus amyloliquefaciens]ALX48111.1 glycine--tRNA ligase subunit beta [Lentibacillus amyloliquefaciens]
MAKDVLVEIGLEELPARFVDNAEKQFLDRTREWFNESRISYESIVSYSTPRRLAVLVKAAAEEQTSLEEAVKGPALKIAQDEDGNWTKAAIGFTKGQGKTVDDIYTKDIKGTSYIFVTKQIIGKPTKELLPEFSQIITSIQFPKNMRWAEQTLRYARPIRWLTALFGQEIIPFEVAGVSTNNRTFGHRFLGEAVRLREPADYEETLEKQAVIVDPQKRKQMIIEGMNKTAAENDFHIPEDDRLLQEVANLVEYPTVFVGSFNPSYLKLPADVLITSMKEHQRYFPVKSKNKELLPYFVGVRNGDNHALQTVIKGNEKVLRARLSDAQFFYEEDQKQSIEFYLEKLERIVFQEKLGTIADKVNRITAIAKQLSGALELDEGTRTNTVRAAEICKFDLPTNMVNEFTNLQGIIGETYALNAGETKASARAVSEHYMPVQADGNIPGTVEGAIVSVADKLDTIVGCISAGLIPTGSQDPYGLRRQATGVLRILKAYNWNISVESLLQLAEQQYAGFSETEEDQAREETAQFFRHRITYLLKETSIEQDVIQAVLYNEIGVIPYMALKAETLSNERNNPDFKPVQEALVRVLNLAAKTDETTITEAVFETESEQKLYDTYLKVKNAYTSTNQKQQARETLNQLGRLAQPIHAFFDHNMVMTDDERIQKNRLALLNSIATLIYDYADLSAIEWKQHF